MTYAVWVWNTGLQLHSFFKLVSKLAAIALINSLDDLMLSPGGLVEAENPPLARAAAGSRGGTKNQVLLSEDRDSSRELDIKILVSKCPLSVFCSQRAGLRFEFSLPQLGGCEKLSGTYPETRFFYYRRSFQPPARVHKPGKREFFCLSVLVISIADSDFVQAFCQQVNKLLITDCP
jgi:hypothetical protein